MDTKKIIFLYKTVLCTAIVTFSAGLFAADQIEFRYDKLLSKAFSETGSGDTIPVTIEKSVETDGSATLDGDYMYYASDRERGNYDIYLRLMSDITVVRLTSHASKDYAPAISPDGKTLVFISNREDPQGDVYVLDVDSKKIIEDRASRKADYYDNESKNITQVIDPVQRSVKTIRDADPAWSPDSGSIVFSSERDGEENIYIMTRNGKKIRALTKMGGLYPSFSPDGKNVIFISYRDNAQGDIYSVDVLSGAEKRITNAAGIKLYPVYMNSTDEIAYTLIDSDTNNDGKINFSDNSSIIYQNTVKKMSYPLTLPSDGAFRARYFPIYALKFYSSEEYNYKGIFLYSVQVGSNININIMPSYGVIPKRKSASDQFDLAENYAQTDDDSIRYITALMRVYNFYGLQSDIESQVFSVKALYNAAVEYRKLHDSGNMKKCIAILESLAKEKNYSAAKSKIVKEYVSGKEIGKLYDQWMNIVSDNKEHSFLTEDAADYYRSQGNTGRALHLYQSISSSTPDYRRMSNVLYAIGSIKTQTERGSVPAEFIELYKKGKTAHREKASNDLIGMIVSQKNPAVRNQWIQSMISQMSVNEELKKSQALSTIELAQAKFLFEQKKVKEAKEVANQVLPRLHKTELLYYDCNLLLSQISAAENNEKDEMKFLAETVLYYNSRWKKPEIRQLIDTLISYYERAGSGYEAAGDFAKAKETYSSYILLLKYLHLSRKFEDVYNEFASRAHVLFINSEIASGENTIDTLETLEKSYLDRLNVARLDFDKALIYGLSYIYIQRAVEQMRLQDNGRIDVTDNSVVKSFTSGLDQIAWAIFMDDAFVDPYILQGWVYQSIDNIRKEAEKSNSWKRLGTFNKAFPLYLWEANTAVYLKGIQENDEVRFPDKEGSLYLNLANTNFLLMNYSSALKNYSKAAEYKKGFSSRKEEALFRYHLAYCYWQAGQIDRARSEMSLLLGIYKSMASGESGKQYAEQIITIYKYLALFERSDSRFNEAFEWYRQALADSAKYKVSIDTERIWIDMGYCLFKQGKNKQSKLYLDRAEASLSKMDENEPSHKLRIELFGLLSFNFYDVGADSMVIGGGRLCSELSVTQKRMLICSINEEISLSEGNYRNAAKSIEKKIGIIGEHDTEFYLSSKIRAMNAAGYCRYLAGDYAKAREFFENGWAFATSKEVNDLDGAFKSIQNLVSLYGVIVENSVNSLKNPISDLSDLSKKINAFISAYESVQFEKRKEQIDSAADASNRKATAKEYADAKIQIAAEAEVLYADLEVSKAILDYYTAELDVVRADGVDSYGAQKVREKNRSLYLSSYAAFAKYLDAGKVLPADTRIKLTFNRAACSLALGEYSRAYQEYGAVEKIVSAGGRDALAWQLFYREALLLEKGKASVDPDYSQLILKYYRLAAGIIERFPSLYAESSDSIRKMYESYVSYLTGIGDTKTALLVYERSLSVERIISVYNVSPVFASEDRRTLYDEYISSVESIKTVMNQKKTLVDSAAALNAPAVINNANEYKAAEEKYMKIIEKIKNKDAYLSWITSIPSDNGISVPDGSSVFVFIEMKKGIAAWRAAKTVSFSLLPQKENIAQFVNDTAQGSKYILITDTSVDPVVRKKMNGISYIPSISSLSNLPKTQNVIYSKAIDIQNSPVTGMGNADIVVMKNDRESTSYLLEGMVSPISVIIPHGSAHLVRGVANAALFDNVRSVYVSDENPSGISSRLMTFSGITDQNQINGSWIIGVRDEVTGSAADKSAFTESAKNTIGLLLRNGDVRSAITTIGRYESISGDKPGSAQFRAMAYEIGDNMNAAVSQQMIAETSGQTAAVSYLTYLLLLEGRCFDAESIMIKNAGVMNTIPEYPFYQSIIKSVKENVVIEKVPEKTNIDKARLELIYAMYSSLSGSPVQTVIGVPAYPFSESEKIAALYYTGSLPAKSISGQLGITEEIISGHVFSPEKVIEITSTGKRLSSLTAASFSASKQNVSIVGTLDINKIVSNSSVIDVIHFLEKYEKLCTKSKNEIEFMRANDLLINTAQKNGIISALLRTQIDRVNFECSRAEYKSAYDIFKKIDGVRIQRTDLAVRYKLLEAEINIFGGQPALASTMLSAMECSRKEDELMKNLLIAHATRMEIIADPSSAKEGLKTYDMYMKKVVSLLSGVNLSYEGAIRHDLLKKGMDFIVFNSAGNGDNVTRSFLRRNEKEP